MENRPNWALLARYIVGKCSSTEKRRVEAWIRADPSRKQLIAELRSIWGAADGSPRQTEAKFDAESGWQDVHSEMESSTAEPAERDPRESRVRKSRVGRRTPRRRSSWRSVALVGLLFLLAGLWLVHEYRQVESPSDGSSRTVVTQQGERSRVQLADGSSVMLNVESKLQLPSTFSDKKRVVHLTGEAYFEVESDADRPFMVETDDASVEVRGTAFNVRGYPDDGEVHVAVAEGGVSFQPNREGTSTEAVQLKSGEVGWLTEADTTVQTTMADVTPYIGWIEGRLIFEATPLPKVAQRLERWYGLDFQIRDSGLRSLRLTANLKSQSIKNVLDVISASLDIQYRMDGNTVHLLGRQSESRPR